MQSLTLPLYRYLLITSYRQRCSKGFTLMELLISLLIASMVIAGLLYGVVQLTTMDKREANLDQVQRDMNRAMEYITNDLQEAVYVYPSPQTVTTQLVADSSFPGGAGETPVLAFWRVDPLETNLPTCNAATMTAIDFQQCELLKIRQAAYTLVVYVQKVNDSNQNWPGQSRIIRYELSKYSDLANLVVRSGYRDPTDPLDPKASFEAWQTNGTPAGSAAVLVDYVQAPTFTTPVALNRAPLNDTGGACYGYGLAGSSPIYRISPSNATTNNNNTFFACIRNPSIGTGVNTRGNQDVYLFLKGNVQSVSGGVRGYSNKTSLPILETQVLVKGVVNKGFSQ